MCTLVALVAVSFLLVSSVGLALADGLKPATKLSRDLATLARPPMDVAAAPVPGSWTAMPPVVTGDWVTIDATAASDPAVLEAELIALGAQHTAIAGRMVSARFPIAAIPSLERVASLQFARAAHRLTNAGRVTSQGDAVMRANTARTTFGVDGTGILVGVLSDSYNCLGGAATDIIFDDLPAAGVNVIQEDPPGGPCAGADEGRAMLQIVHDVAPGANLSFATAFTGQAGFAANIRALRDAGASVIVDDVIYFGEPMFQDGVIAQAVDDVVGSGVSYFSAAGNFARKAYEEPFNAGTFVPPFTHGAEFLGGIPHRFGGTTTMQRVSGPPGSFFQMVLQWDQPFFCFRPARAASMSSPRPARTTFSQAIRSSCWDSLRTPPSSATPSEVVASGTS
jgi:hypothetical protein